MSMHYIVRAISQHRGAPRIYLDDGFLANSAFQPGTSYSIVAHQSGGVTIRTEAQGKRKVSAKLRRGRMQPVIDINNRTDLAVVSRSPLVRIVIDGEAIHVLLPASEVNRLERIDRLLARLVQRKPLRMASFAHGAGVLSHAAHSGLANVGMPAELTMANEIAVDMAEHASLANSAWSSRTKALAAPIQEVAQDAMLLARLGPVEIMEAGLSCSGAGKAGKAKHGLACMEAHPTVGHLVAPAIMMIQHLQPVVFALENTPDYANSASAEILRKMLHDMSYDVIEVKLDARAYGSQEARVRWFLVAVTMGIELDITTVHPVESIQAAPLATVLDDTVDESRWGTFEGLIAKQERNAAAGDRFRMQIVSEGDCQVPTLRKGYYKGGSSDPLLAHPTKPGLMRKFTSREHARIKGVPASLIEGLSESTAHQALGQGVAYRPVERLFEVIGEALKRFAEKGDGGAMVIGRRRQDRLATATG